MGSEVSVRVSDIDCEVSTSSNLVSVSPGVWVGSLETTTQELLSHDTDRMLAALQESNGADAVLSYVFVRDLLCMVTPGENIFSLPTLSNLEAMARNMFVPASTRRLLSTPQLRAFLSGSFRAWGKDMVREGFHYLAVISAPEGQQSKPHLLDIEVPSASVPAPDHHLAQVVNVELVPGRIVLHKTTLQYRLSCNCLSSDPREGLLLVDGYIW